VRISFFRLHDRMHLMLTTVTDDRVCHAAHLGFTVQKWLNTKMFVLNTPGGPWNIVLDVGLDPPQRGQGCPLLNFGTPSYFWHG